MMKTAHDALSGRASTPGAARRAVPTAIRRRVPQIENSHGDTNRYPQGPIQETGEERPPGRDHLHVAGDALADTRGDKMSIRCDQSPILQSSSERRRRATSSQPASSHSRPASSTSSLTPAPSHSSLTLTLVTCSREAHHRFECWTDSRCGCTSLGNPTRQKSSRSIARSSPSRRVPPYPPRPSPGGPRYSASCAENRIPTTEPRVRR
ncbi:hypothetical protein C8R45DRAFT_628367 [Mycena sanguinolenta]|nr:hypothetical protein C8R45DRAFT_628367 [Mycena sanguinolenta]